MKTQEKRQIENTFTNTTDIDNKIEDLILSNENQCIITPTIENEKNVRPNTLIKLFDKKIEENYINKSKKLITYKVYNLSRFRNTKTNEVFNLTHKYKDLFAWIPEFTKNDKLSKQQKQNKLNNYKLNSNDLTITGDKGHYLKGLDNIRRNKNHSKVKYLEYKNNKVDENGIKLRKPFFITFTNNTQHHFLKKDYENNEKYIHNPKCGNRNFEDTIRESLENQVKIWKYFFKNLKTQLKRNGLNEKVDFVRVFEQTSGHSNLHSHMIIWCDNNEESINVLNKSFLQTVKKFKLYKCECKPVEDNVEDLNKRNKNSRKRRHKTYKKVNSPTSYITKYMSKGNISYYEKYFSDFRFFSCSGFEKTTQKKIDALYTHLSKYEPKLMERFKKSKLPLYLSLELYMEKNITFSYNETITNSVNFTKIKKDSNELKELKLENWETMEILEKEENPINYLEKLSKTNIDKELIKEVNDLYNSISFFNFKDNEIIEQLTIKLKENLIFNEFDIINHIQDNIQDYKKLSRNYTIKSIYDRKTNIKTTKDYELLEPLSNDDIMKELWGIDKL